MTTSLEAKRYSIQPILVNNVWQESARLLEVHTPWIKGQRRSWAFFISNRVPRRKVLDHIRAVWKESDYKHTNPVLKLHKCVMMVPIHEVHTREIIENDILDLGAD